MAYVLEFVDAVEPEDQVFEDHGVKVFIDPKSMTYLDGDRARLCARGPKRRSAIPQSQCLGRMRLRGEFHRISSAVRCSRYGLTRLPTQLLSAV